MSSFKLISSETVKLTPELAQQFRDMEPSRTERPISPSRMKDLREKAAAGLLVSFNWSSAILDDQELRMNGQHSSNMLCELNGEFPDGLIAHRDRYAVSDKTGLALLFRQFDSRKSSRTPGDVAGAYQGLYDELSDVNRDIAKRGIEGVAWYRDHIVGEPPLHGDDIFTLFNERRLDGYLHWLDDVLDKKTPEMKRTPVVAAMHATFMGNSDAAREFWAAVARGSTGVYEDTPATVLDDWLKNVLETTDPVARVKQGFNQIKPAEFFNGCIWCWNAFRQNKTIKEVKHNTTKGWHTIAD